MAKLGISIKIDVTKIDKDRIFKGKKGQYIDLTTFIDLDNQDDYGYNGFISQSVSQEERQMKVQTPILGNCKVFYKEGQESGSKLNPPFQSPVAQHATPDNFDDDIPF
jgi:hypothetical protein